MVSHFPLWCNKKSFLFNTWALLPSQRKISWHIFRRFFASHEIWLNKLFGFISCRIYAFCKYIQVTRRKAQPNLIVLPRAQRHWVLLLKAALRCFEVWWVRIEWECFPSQGSPFVAAWPRRGGSLWTRSQWRRRQGWSRPPARARWRRAGRQGRARPFLRTWNKKLQI